MQNTIENNVNSQNGYNVETINGYGFCTNSKEVVFRFTNFSLHVFGSGEHEMRPIVPYDVDVPDDARKSLWRKSHLDGEELQGAYTRQNYAGLGYAAQDEFTQRLANAEHAALHLWIDEMKAAEFLQRDSQGDDFIIAIEKILTADAGLTDGMIEELFTTAIQLLANGVQINYEIGEDIYRTSRFMGLSDGNASLSALAFINYFRAYTRNAFAEKK